MFQEAFLFTKMPPDTTLRVTRTQWEAGWYAPQCPWEQRVRVAGNIIKFCLLIAQDWCPIRREALCVVADFTTVQTVRTCMEATDFDHCISALRGTDHSSGTCSCINYWLSRPLVGLFGREKRSGCFCHKTCRWRGLKMQ